MIGYGKKIHRSESPTGVWSDRKRRKPQLGYPLLGGVGSTVSRVKLAKPQAWFHERSIMKIPFQERKTKLRGVLDIITGCYPSFLFGGRLGGILPVFHFHDVTREYLEPYLKYLSENGYKTVASKEMGEYIRNGVSVGDKTVVLSFDDAWASMHEVVFPLLNEYSFRAITYVAPSLIEDAVVGDRFVTWDHLKDMSNSGLVDVQSHTWSHAMIYDDDVVVDWVKPDYDRSLMAGPVIEMNDVVTRVTAEMLGRPLYRARSRMSDALRYIDDPSVHGECVAHVNANGGAEFFKGESWQEQLMNIVLSGKGRFETEAERLAEIKRELARSKEVLQLALGTKIRQVCMPWAVGGDLAEETAKAAGYETMVADELYGKRFLVKGGNPYRIMRLKHQYIYCLPGNDRKTVFSC